MQAAVLEAPGRFSIAQREKPEIGPNELLVRAAVCGMCTSELDMFLGHGNIQYPRYCGHEVSGYVAQVGSRVKGFEEGDRVALYAEGEGFAEYIAVPAAWAVKLKADTPFDLALGEPIACSVNGVRKAQPQLGDSVAMVGCGFMGLMLVQLFKAAGAGWVAAIDRRDSVLDLARQLGADYTFNPDRDDVKNEIHALTDGRGVDIGVETAGVQQTLDLTTELVRMEGKLEVFGFHQGKKREVDWGYWNWMAFQIINGHTRSQHIYVEGMKIGIEMLERGQLDMQPLVTHRFSLDRIQEGFEAAASKTNGFIKGVVTFE